MYGCKVYDCLVDRCAPVPVIHHALHNSSLTIRGTVVHYNCEAGYQPTGPMDIVCDGQSWSSLTSRCTGKYTTVDGITALLVHLAEHVVSVQNPRVCLCVNQGRPNHNRYTWRLVILHGDLYTHPLRYKNIDL